MSGTGESSMLEALHPTGREDSAETEVARQEERSILGDLNHIGEHIQTLEEAARAARAVEFEQLRSVVAQLELVADAAKQVEGDLARELSETSRVSVATARLVRQRLASALRALSDALSVGDDEQLDVG
jgi:hypothetical protein